MSVLLFDIARIFGTILLNSTWCSWIKTSPLELIVKVKGSWSSDKESAADSLSEDQEPLTLTINSKGEVFIQEHQVAFDKIIPKILAISNNRTDTRIYVRGDKTINYGRVLEVMGMLSGGGFSKVALISEPYKN